MTTPLCLPRLAPAADALQAVAAARRDAQHIPRDWRNRLGAVLRDLRAMSGLALMQVTARGTAVTGAHRFGLTTTRSMSENDPHQKFFIQLQDCTDFVINGLVLRRGRNAILLHRCRRFRILNIDLSDLEGYGIILFDCSEFEVAGIRARNLLCSAIMALGDTSMGLIHRVDACGGRGFLNCDAAIHLSQCTPAVTVDDVPERNHEAYSIIEKTKRPRCIEMSGMCLQGNRAQAVYLEGAIACRISRSLLDSCNKEGICFDWGTACCELTQSIVSRNGRRAAMTLAEIRADFIEQFPLLPDNSSSVKLPGISLDNAAFNTVRCNLVVGNYGGAVKLIRACAGNRFHWNLGGSNTRGSNEHISFAWFNDLGAGDLLGEFAGIPPCDIGPSYENIYRRNRILG